MKPIETIYYKRESFGATARWYYKLETFADGTKQLMFNSSYNGVRMWCESTCELTMFLRDIVKTQYAQPISEAQFIFETL